MRWRPSFSTDSVMGPLFETRQDPADVARTRPISRHSLSGQVLSDEQFNQDPASAGVGLCSRPSRQTPIERLKKRAVPNGAICLRVQPA